MRVRNVGRRQEKVSLMMTPMIDIVFQLLVFFIMTFKIVTLEGDFNIKMPIADPNPGQPDDTQFPPLKVTLRATDGGRLASITLGERPIRDFAHLREQVRSIVGDDTGPGSVAADQEVELDCDYNLDFEAVIDTITAVSGYVRNGRIIKLVEKIKFAPPRQEPAGQ